MRKTKLLFATILSFCIGISAFAENKTVLDYSETINADGSKERTEFTYDENGNQILRVSYTWDSETNAWVNKEKSERTLDVNNKETFYAYYKWDSETKAWICDEKRERQYRLLLSEVVSGDHLSAEVTSQVGPFGAGF